MLMTFIEICREIPNLFMIKQKRGKFYMGNYVDLMALLAT